jgi:hypothetical protein
MHLARIERRTTQNLRLLVFVFVVSCFYSFFACCYSVKHCFVADSAVAFCFYFCSFSTWYSDCLMVMAMVMAFGCCWIVLQEQQQELHRLPLSPTYLLIVL